MKKIYFIIMVLFFTNCTVKYIKTAPTWESDIQNIKRLVIDISKESNIDSDTRTMVASMSESYLSHHKEFIIYPFEKSSKNICGNSDPSVKHIMLLTVNELMQESKIDIGVTGRLIQCSDSSVLWEGFAQNVYKPNPSENLSLVRTYTQMVGPKIADKVTPYFVLLQALLERIESPILTEDEKDEKIEVEAR
ncbi:MXAN_6521/LA_1396 family lipoprotein [Leptospira sp. GIMC2001]|uniref:MXAN_6521/LA_1396 family lipoprotein n=1 Tax=Leptospira sp. GIMC2001 TaxID=1513297 RepID=UPI00234BA2AF|nr:MXAN_6521/LA_1396 family lipoprotein [Leptospira sp. GIMC2001]WCL50462.1 MXAN_6521/LA_1396 family lipoprotein [Leptospira sp. GIMC2001]